MRLRRAEREHRSAPALIWLDPREFSQGKSVSGRQLKQPFIVFHRGSARPTNQENSQLRTSSCPAADGHCYNARPRRPHESSIVSIYCVWSARSGRIALTASAAQAPQEQGRGGAPQPPLQNLQVFPKDTPRAQVVTALP